MLWMASHLAPWWNNLLSFPKTLKWCHWMTVRIIISGLITSMPGKPCYAKRKLRWELTTFDEMVLQHFGNHDVSEVASVTLLALLILIMTAICTCIILLDLHGRRKSDWKLTRKPKGVTSVRARLLVSLRLRVGLRRKLLWKSRSLNPRPKQRGRQKVALPSRRLQRMLLQLQVVPASKRKIVGGWLRRMPWRSFMRLVVWVLSYLPWSLSPISAWAS